MKHTVRTLCHVRAKNAASIRGEQNTRISVEVHVQRRVVGGVEDSIKVAGFQEGGI